MRSHQKFTGLNLWQLVRRLSPTNHGEESNLLDEIGKHVRFRGHISYQHSGHEVAYVDMRQQPVEVFLNENILAGLSGPLPAPYMELCYQRQRDGDPAMAVFLDIFNHRLNALRYSMRARTNGDLSLRAPEQTLPGQLLNAINGDPSRQIAEGDDAALQARNLLGLAGLLHHHQRSHTVVQLILRKLIKLPLKLTSFEGGWLPLDEDQQIRLGQDNSRLGESAVLGRRCWDQHRALGLRIDVPDYQTLIAFLPKGERHDWLCRLVRWITHYRFDINVSLRLPIQAGNGLLLASSPEQGLRLSYTSWLNNHPNGEIETGNGDQQYRVSRYTIAALGGVYDTAA